MSFLRCTAQTVGDGTNVCLDFGLVERKGYGAVKILRGEKKIDNCRSLFSSA